MFKLYCRIYQFMIRRVSPLLKWREPVILHSYLELVNTLKAQGKKRVLLVSDQGLAKLELYGDLVRNLERNAIDVVIYHGVTSNPTIRHVEEALALYNAESCEALIGFGGGSPLDVAKVVAAKLARPNKAITKMKGILKIGKKTPLLIAVPTTSGTGSEATLAAVIIDEKTRSKYAINDPVLFPSYALLLPELTIALPKNITAETGMDVLTHA
ncbi:MAG TPA: iron-containing alcohol dehydrogenase, partial [Bacilli bacterium]|nr:iron-containing alcohol dehydrogenase [Bacilli bacterium]